MCRTRRAGGLAAFRFEMGSDRRSGRARVLARAGPARLPAVAELPHAADAPPRRRSSRWRISAPPISAPRPSGCSSTRCSSRPAPRCSRSCVGTALAWMNERTNTPFKTLFFALVDHPAGDSRHPVHGGVDHAGEPEDRRSSTSSLQKLFGTDAVLVQHLLLAGHDLGRRPALLADGVPADDGGVPLDGSVARGIGDDERRHRCCRSRWRITLKLAWPAALGVAPDPVRALDRIVRGAGAARAAGRHPGLHLVDLPGDPPVSEPDRARRRPMR